MGKTALDIVRQFVSDTGLELSGTSLRNCTDFAEVILQMQKDSRLSKPSVRNCLRYAESKVEKEHQISHGTFYNDKDLKAMMHWFISNNGEGDILLNRRKDVNELEETIRKQKKQIKGLIVFQQSFDSVNNALAKEKMNSYRNKILFERAMSVLKQLGKDSEVDMSVPLNNPGAFDIEVVISDHEVDLQ